MADGDQSDFSLRGTHVNSGGTEETFTGLTWDPGTTKGMAHVFLWVQCMHATNGSLRFSRFIRAQARIGTSGADDIEAEPIDADLDPDTSGYLATIDQSGGVIRARVTGAAGVRWTGRMWGDFTEMEWNLA